MPKDFDIGKQFNRAMGNAVEAEKALAEWGVPFRRQPNGSLIVDGDLDISSKGLTSLPDLTSVIIQGMFLCNYNKLTSLRGAPQNVGSFSCEGNQLTTLVGAPQNVGGSFNCSHNQLTSLIGVPQVIVENFYCTFNLLTSLEDGPLAVGRDFRCDYNQLTSLKGAPSSFVAGAVTCTNNPLTSLEHAPPKFQVLQSDFGTFNSWDDIPERLRTSPETKELIEQSRRAAEEHAIAERERSIHDATVLGRPIGVQRPLSFKA